MVVTMLIVSFCLTILFVLTKHIVVSAFMMSILVFLFFAFRSSYEAVRNVQMLTFSVVCGTPSSTIDIKTFIFVWLAFGVFAFCACMKKREYLLTRNAFVNIVAFCCVLVAAVDILSKEFSRRQIASSVVEAVQTPGIVPLLESAKMPDIYYIILDGCARPDILKSLYRYDNDKFCNYLKGKGFHIVENSHSNYQMTPLSLASTLNMNYVNAIEKIMPESNDWFPMIELIENNLVVKALKAVGYKYVMFRSDWSVTQKSPLADELIAVSWNDVFLNRLLGTTLWPYIEEHTGILRNEACAHWLRTFERAGNLDHVPSPKIVFLHCVLPHPPYLFKADGGRVSKGHLVMHLDDYADKYAFVEQVKFTEAKVEGLVDQLLAKQIKPIVIVQSDHGPASLDSGEGIESPTKAFLRERMSIINAYYFPESDYSGIHPSITPVNTFRLVVNKYFGGRLDLLPDRSYFSNYLLPYKFTDVTQQLEH